MKLLSLFSGIGAFEKALDRKGIDYDLVNYCELDKFASKSYSAIHNVPETLNLGDITKVKIDELEPYSADLITYGFPCQDISNAGKQRGFEHDGQLTRSGLFFYAAAIIGRIQPKVAICENVKALTGKKFKEEFSKVLSTLEDMGYKNYWQVLNAKDYGIPQNRERVFIVSIRNDIDKKYEFPTPIKLELRLKDSLEKEVDEKYYLSNKMLKYFNRHNERHISKGTGFIHQTTDVNGIAKCLRANGALCATDNTIEVEPKHLITVKEATKKGYTEAYEGDSINLEQPNSKTRRGRVGKQVTQTLTTSPQQAVVLNPVKLGYIPYPNSDKPHQSNTFYSKDAICPTLDTCTGGNRQVKIQEDLRIRKLTPLECWRLMGFDDADFYKAEAVNSNTQLYKQAGNSIVVNVLEAIFENLKDILY